jgi:cation:H+ antiporter
MTVLVQMALFTVGLGLLYFGAETLVKGSVRLATSFGVSKLIVGLTLVAFGTSAPELSLDVTAAFRGAVELAFGDLVGSNIANIGLVLGAGALVRPIRVQKRLLRTEVPIVVAVSLVLWAMAADGEIGRGDAVILGVGFFAFLTYMFRSALRKEFDVQEELSSLVHAQGGRGKATLMVLGGLAGLVVGAQFMVFSAVALARILGVSELVIGLTVVAVGTSLPELATSVVASYRGEADISVGNVLGSNVFNLLWIMALVALIHPLPVMDHSLNFDLPVMVAFAVGLAPIMFRGLAITRWEGGLLLAGYAFFLGMQAF